MSTVRTIRSIWLVPILLVCAGSSYSGEFPAGGNGGESNRVKVHTVQIVQMKFDPAEIHVRKGDKIVFINRDMVIHDVTEETRRAWKSPPIPVGGSWTLVVRRSDRYFCSIHQVMKGRIVADQ